MSSINPVRGEVALTLDGKEYPMLPTYGAMVAIEQQLGSVVMLARRFARADLTLREVSIIACETIKAAGADRKDPMLSGVSAEVLAEKMYAQGLLESMKPMDLLLTNMITGGTTPKKSEAAPT